MYNISIVSFNSSNFQVFIWICRVVNILLLKETATKLYMMLKSFLFQNMAFIFILSIVKNMNSNIAGVNKKSTTCGCKQLVCICI